MGDKLNIADHELRASGRAARDIAREVEEPLRTAVRDLEDAGAAMRQWTLGRQLIATAEGWGGVLGTLRRQVSENGDALFLVADGHDANEQLVADKFHGW
jgi:hypothetical protein